jgi:lysophospholipase L1-like esterase
MFGKPVTVVKTKSRGLLINLALLLISTVIGLLLSEIALRLMGRGPLYVSPERDRFWKYDSLLGWAHQPGQEGIFESPQFRTSVVINQKGLRDRDHSYERVNDAKRILVIGDSFAWGYGVEESERFSQILENSLNVEVINAGVSGYSTDQELLWLQTEGVKYDFDLVILVMAGNDIGDNDQQLVHTIYYKPQFVLEAGRLILKGTPVPKASAPAKFVYSLTQHSALAFFLVQRYFDLLHIYSQIKHSANNGNSGGLGASADSDPFELTTALLDEIRNITEQRQAKFMIVATSRWWNAPKGVTYKNLIGTLQDQGFPVLDVESMPGFEPEAMLIPDDGHWNVFGHQFVAQQIKDFIENNQLLGQPQNPEYSEAKVLPVFGGQ